MLNSCSINFRAAWHAQNLMLRKNWNLQINFLVILVLCNHMDAEKCESLMLFFLKNMIILSVQFEDNEFLQTWYTVFMVHSQTFFTVFINCLPASPASHSDYILLSLPSISTNTFFFATRWEKCYNFPCFPSRVSIKNKNAAS